VPKRYAILLSAETYNNQPPTPHCHADRKLLFDALVNNCDYAPGDVVSLGLDQDDDSVGQIRAAIDKVKAKLQRGDTVLFYYAGHGVSVDGEPYLFLPISDIGSIEKTAIPIRDVSDELRLDRNGCFRIFDSCHSGIDVRDTDHVTTSLVRGVAERAPDGWITIAGCAADEKCHSSDIEGHGVFTYRLVQALQEIEPGKQVVPETLKVRTCELVAEWCADSGRQQRPTLIGTVHGNLSIGTRRTEKAVNEEIEVGGVPDEAAAAIKARLTELQGSAPPGSEEYWKRYGEAKTILRECAENNRDLLKPFGVQLSEIEEVYIEEAADDLEQPVVDLVHQKGWRSLHNIKREVHYNSSPFASIFTITQGIATRTIERTVEQDRSSPAAVLKSQLPPSGATPGLRVVHYLCPLQTHFMAYSRYIVTGVLNDDGQLAHGWYRTVGTEGCEKDIRHHVAFVQKKALEAYQRACETNVSYLESEKE
jgi:co-chaperonin GroES (HSP10)